MRDNKILYKLNQTEKLLISFSASHGLYQIFLGTFVVSFLMHNTNNQIVSVSVYNLFFYFAVMLTFVIMLNWCKRSNATFIFGTHIVLKMILMVLIAFLGPRTTDFIFLLGLMYGVQDALYNMSSKQLIIDKIHANRMMFYFGTSFAISNLVKILIPIILGILITIASLQNIAWVMFSIGIIELLLLTMVPPLSYQSKHPADLANFIKNSIKTPCIRTLFCAEFLRGVGYVLETVGIMYIVYVFHTDMNLGIWTTVFAVCTTVAVWTFGRFCSKRDFKWVITLTSLLLVIAVIFLIIYVNNFSTLVYAGTVALGVGLMDQVYSVNVLNLAKTKLITQKYRPEYLTACEIMLFFGRWAGILPVLYIGVFGNYAVLPYVILILAIGKVLASFLYVSLGNYTRNN